MLVGMFKVCRMDSFFFFLLPCPLPRQPTNHPFSSLLRTVSCVASRSSESHSHTHNQPLPAKKLHFFAAMLPIFFQGIYMYDIYACSTQTCVCAHVSCSFSRANTKNKKHGLLPGTNHRSLLCNRRFHPSLNTPFVRNPPPPQQSMKIRLPCSSPGQGC